VFGVRLMPLGARDLVAKTELAHVDLQRIWA